MQYRPYLRRVPRAVVIPTVFGLGVLTALGLRGQAGQPVVTTPVQPSVQALETQTAFENVADSLRPSVVFINSRQTIKPQQTGRVFQGQFGGQDDPFGAPQMPGFPGQGGGGQPFRMMPQSPMYPRHAEASGSGVIVRSDGYILTNDHVVAGADKVTVRLLDGREFTGKVMRDQRSDLALIKIDATGLPAAQMADSDKVKIGQWAIAFGSPFRKTDTMTVGIVSALHRREEIGGGGEATRLYPSLIQTDASINPGNSGGPLVDLYGRVVGINVAIESPTGSSAGIGFAIPANTAKYIVDQLIARGSVTRGFLGLAPTSLTYEQQQQYGVKQGALVDSVQDNTPASKAGFQVEDVIVRYDGNPITDEAALRDFVSRTEPGRAVDVVVKRGGLERTLRVTIGNVDQQKQANVSPPSAPQQKAQAQGKLGIRVADASNPEIRQQLNLQANASGAVVAELAPGSPAAEAGLQPGDIIVRLSGKSVSSAADLVNISGQLKSGATVQAVVRRGNQTILVPINLE